MHKPFRSTLIATSAALGVTAALLAPSPADAAVRYASPGSVDTTGDCLSVPCRVDRAVAVAASYDSVELAAGTYNISYPVSASALIYIYGAPGGTPSLIGSANSATLEMRWGGTLENVYAYTNVTGQYALDLEAVNAQRVTAEADGAAHAVNLVGTANGTVLRNSLARVRSGNGIALNLSGTGGGRSTTVVNATALSPGGTAIATGGNATKTIKNTIARGLTDFAVSTVPDVSYSNFRPSSSTGAAIAGTGNQTAQDPVWAGAATGDFGPAAGSPVVDAGAADALTGGFDRAGATRTVGGGIDIGAFERQADPPPPDPDPDPDPDPGTDPGTSNGSTPGGGPGTTTGTGSGSGTAAGSGSGTDPSGGTGSTPPALPPAGDPVRGTTVTLGEVNGTPLVRLPGTTTFVPLTADSTVPVGAVVDATRGTIELTSALDAAGRKTQTGTFWGGAFKVAQSRREAAVELSLQGGSFGACPAKRRGRSARSDKLAVARGRHKATIRRLWGRDRGGRFRTRGRNGSATVRGTRWLTADRCDGTYFKVAEGAIDVRDERARRTVRVKRGGSYLAAAQPAARRPR